MIPKQIHYVWFGPNEPDELAKTCIDSWKRHMPNYEIIKWSENNIDVNSHPYMSNAYSDKKWAFVSDYARLKVLYENGGIYLDTDMYMVKPLDDLLDLEAFVGKEDDKHLNAAILAATSGHTYIKDLLTRYDNLNERVTIPRVMTEVYNENKDKYNIKVFDKVFFYPYSQENISSFNKHNAPIQTYGVHMWNYSWGHPLVKLTKKLKLHRIIIDILDSLRIKNFIKKLFKSA